MRSIIAIGILCYYILACSNNSDVVCNATLAEVHDTNPPQILILDGTMRNIVLNVKGVKRQITFVYTIDNPNENSCLLPLDIVASVDGKTVKPLCSAGDTLRLAPKEKVNISVTLTWGNMTDLLLVSDTLTTKSIMNCVKFENRKERSGTKDSDFPALLFSQNNPVYICLETQMCKTHNPVKQ